MQPKQTRLNPVSRSRAIELRRLATVPERMFWNAVSAKKLAGLKFRRQHVIEPYVVDFYCASKNLVIELDGESHEGRQAYDSERQTFIESKGYRVLRFANDDVVDNLDGVLEAILMAIGIDPEKSQTYG